MFKRLNSLLLSCLILCVTTAFLFKTSTVAAAEPSRFDVKIICGDSQIEHKPDETYYCNTDVKICIPEELLQKASEEEVLAAAGEIKELYPDENVSYYVDEYYGYALYDGEKFSDYTELGDNREIIMSALDGTQYDREVCVFKSDFSYKVYRENSGGDRTVERIIEKEYISGTYQIILDKAAPIISLENNISEDENISEEREITADITDLTGLKIIRFIKNDRVIDEISLEGETRIVDYRYTFSLSKENENEDNIRLEAVDLAGNTSEYSLSYRIDKKAPVMTLAGAENGRVYADAVAVQVSVEDDSNKGFVFYKCMFMDENRNRSCIENQTIMWDGKGLINRSYSQNGIYDISAFSYDESGNYTELYTVSFAVDNRAPEVALGNVNDGGIYNSSVAVYATLKDLFYENVTASISGTVTSGDELYINSERINKSSSDSTLVSIKSDQIPWGTDSKATTELSLEPYDIKSVVNKNIYTFASDGCYRISFSASDGNGKNSTVGCSFTIDTTAPEIYIGSINDNGDFNVIETEVLNQRPIITVGSKDALSDVETIVKLTRKKSDGSYEVISETTSSSLAGTVLRERADSSANINLSGTTGHSTYEAALVNQTEKTADLANSEKYSTENNHGRAVQLEVTVPYEGEYELYVLSKDGAGNISEKHAEFTVDENPPLIGYLDSFNEKYLKGFILPGDLSDYIQDMTRVKYKAYLNSKEISDGEIRKDGKYLLSVVAVDDAGNKSEKNIAFIVDSRKPKVVVSGVSGDGTVKKGDEIRLSLLDEDDYFVKASLNGQEIDIVNYGKEVYINSDQYGLYDISVTASDYAGNEVTQVIKAECVSTKNGMGQASESINVKTLTKNEGEIRESFFEKKWLVAILIFCGIITATVVILGVTAFVDRKKVKCDTNDTDESNNI